MESREDHAADGRACEGSWALFSGIREVCLFVHVCLCVYVCVHAYLGVCGVYACMCVCMGVCSALREEFQVV